MSGRIAERANFYGLNAEQVEILIIVTWWFNGHSLKTNGEVKQIGTHKEPTLEELFQGWGKEFTLDHEEAHRRLRNKGVLKEEWLCRRKVDWLPTELFLTIVRDVLKDRDDLRPTWDDERPAWARNSDSPICGDPNELLAHRKGVEAAAAKARRFDWVKKIEWYPDHPEIEHVLPDLELVAERAQPSWRVEVLTENNNTAQWERKWELFTDYNWRTWWVFTSRELMCRFFNHLHRRGIYKLHGKPFSEPYKNWSAKAINRKIWRSKSARRSETDAADLTHTITAIQEADAETVYSWFDEQLSKNYQ